MAEESIFVEYFGDTPLVRIMNFLILGKDFDYSMTEIAEGVGVGWTSFTRAWKILLENNSIVHTREIGRAKLFKLNTNDPTMKKIIKLHWEILKEETNKHLSNTKIPLVSH
ncbi:helix-turn-helix transcriptional regulator [Candidatus Woesearchaeota archaeon]|nr:helix-turn-helix transcriptional regulator [Candidatus Woesearchaeota archaeon]